jgi:hypothetical protein
MSNINTILIKRRTTGEAGAPAFLSGGELAFNEINSVLYYGSENGVIPIGGSGEFATNTLVGSISADLQSQIGTLDLRVTDEVAALNSTVASVSSTLDAKIDSQIAAVIDMAPEALNTLNELAAALGDDENFASNLVSTLNTVNTTMASISGSLQSELDALEADSAQALSDEVARATAAEAALDSKIDSSVSTLNTTVASVSSTLDSKIDSEVADLESAIASEVSTLNSTVASVSATLTSDLAAEVSRATTAEGALSTAMAAVSASLDSKIDSEVADLESAIASEVSTLNTTVQSVSSALASDLAAVNTRVDNVLSNVDATALNSLVEIVDAFQQADNDINSAISLLANNGSTNLASISATLDQRITDEVATLNSTISDEVDRATAAEGVLTSDLAAEVTRAEAAEAALDSKIDSEISTLESAIASEVSTLNTTVQSVSAALASDLANEVTRATAAEGAISSLVSEISGNYLDKRTGGTVTGDLDVIGTISATGGIEISGGGASTSLFVGDGVVGINTETPSEAFEVVGNGKFSGTVEVATPTLNGHAANKGYVDTAIANLVDGAPELLNTLNELASAINDDENFAATIATNIGNVSTTLASVSATLDQRITDEVATLNSTISDEVSRATAAEDALDTRVSTIETNYLDLTNTGEQTVMGIVTVEGQINANTSVVVNNGSGGQSVINGNGTASFDGEVTVAEPTQSNSAATKNYVDYMISVLDGGSF